METIYNNYKSSVDYLIYNKEDDIFGVKENLVNMKSTLYDHQVASVNFMLYKEDMRSVEINNNHFDTNYGILASRTGSGKTLMILSLLEYQNDARKKVINNPLVYSLLMKHTTMPQELCSLLGEYSKHNEIDLQLGDKYRPNSINISGHNGKNLIIVPHFLINQWSNEIKTHISDASNYIVLKNAKDLTKLIENKNQYVNIICKNTLLKNLMEEYAGETWNRLIIDEFDSIKKLSYEFIPSKFYWFVSTTFKRIALSPKTNFISEFFKETLYKKYNDNFEIFETSYENILESFSVYPPIKNIDIFENPNVSFNKHIVDTPYAFINILNIFKDQSVKEEINKLLIKADAPREEGLDYNICIADMPESIIHKLIPRYFSRYTYLTTPYIYETSNYRYPGFLDFREKPAYMAHVTSDSQEQMTPEDIMSIIKNCEKMPRTITKLLNDESRSWYCMYDIRSRENAFDFFRKLITQVSTKGQMLIDIFTELSQHKLAFDKPTFKRILFAREKIINEIAPFLEDFRLINTEDFNREIDSYIHIPQNWIDKKINEMTTIIDFDRISNKKIVLFVNDTAQKDLLIKILENWSISPIICQGNPNTISKRIKDFNKDTPTNNVMIINSKTGSCGLHLPNITDIIIFSSIDKDTFEQVCGRGNRIGRDIGLKLTITQIILDFEEIEYKTMTDIEL